MVSYTFKKAERLCSKTLINNLFEKGNRVTTQFPFRVLWQITRLPVMFPAQVMISVPKRNFAKATDRNRVKRQLRELYRLNKHLLYAELQKMGVQLTLSINYQDRELLTHEQLAVQFDKLLKKLVAQVRSSKEQLSDNGK